MGGLKRLSCLDFFHFVSVSTNSGESIKYGKFSNMNSPTKAPLRVRSSEVARNSSSQTTFLAPEYLNQANQKTSKNMRGLDEVESPSEVFFQRMHFTPRSSRS